MRLAAIALAVVGAVQRTLCDYSGSYAETGPGHGAEAGLFAGEVAAACPRQIGEGRARWVYLDMRAFSGSGAKRRRGDPL